MLNIRCNCGTQLTMSVPLGFSNVLIKSVLYISCLDWSFVFRIKFCYKILEYPINVKM